MNPGAVDSYTFDGEIETYEVTSGYDVFVELDGEETTFAEILEDESSEGNSGDGDDGNSGSDDKGSGDGDGNSGSDDSNSGSDDESSGGDDSGGGNSGGDQQHKVLIVDGTGDAENIAKYEFSVSGSVERDAGRSAASEGLPWDKMTDYVGEGSVVGVVGNGKDAFRFTGNLESISVDGQAGVKIRGA
jgi:hypothetical protein